MTAVGRLGMLLLLVAGCDIDGSVGRVDDTGSSIEGPSAKGEDESGSSGVGEGTSRGDASGEGGVGSGVESGGEETAGEVGGDQATDGESDMACQVHEVDSACVLCRKLHCCAQIEACHGASGCYCMWDCKSRPENSDAFCVELCDYDGVELAELLTCTELDCPEFCQDPLDEPPLD